MRAAVALAMTTTVAHPLATTNGGAQAFAVAAFARSNRPRFVLKERKSCRSYSESFRHAFHQSEWIYSLAGARWVRYLTPASLQARSSPEIAGTGRPSIEPTRDDSGILIERDDRDPRDIRRRRPLVDAKQLSRQEVRRRWPDTNFDVPTNMAAAFSTFFNQSTPRLIIAGISAVALVRLSCGAPLSLDDMAALPVVAIGWSFQEWAIHKYLLHGMQGWLGHDVHEQHHDKPFYHVCVDPPDLVAGWTLAAGCIFRLLLPTPLALTVLAVYMCMGLLYEWTHFMVHTRVAPRSRIGKEVKRHHTLHHLKDEECWLAFTVPPIDKLLGTIPRETPAAPPPLGSSQARPSQSRGLKHHR